MTPAYLIKLSGQGDHDWYLLNQDDWDYFSQCLDWNRSGTPPAPPSKMVERAYKKQQGGFLEPETREQIAEYLTPDPKSGSMINDIALSMPESYFNGYSFRVYDVGVDDINKLNDFVKKHGLTIVDEYEGYIY